MFKATYSILVIFGAKLAIVDEKKAGLKIKINDAITPKICVNIKNLYVQVIIFNNKNWYFLEDICVYFLHNIAT